MEITGNCGNQHDSFSTTNDAACCESVNIKNKISNSNTGYFCHAIRGQFTSQVLMMNYDSQFFIGFVSVYTFECTAGDFVRVSLMLELYDADAVQEDKFNTKIPKFRLFIGTHH